MHTMVPAIRSQSANSSLTSLVASCAILFAVIAFASVLVASVAEQSLSWQSIRIAAVAGSICYVAAASSLIAVFVGNQWALPVHGMLLGMLFRMGLPLTAIIALGNQRTLGATIVVVYLLALVVETFLALRMTPTKSTRSTDAHNSSANSGPRASTAS